MPTRNYNNGKDALIFFILRIQSGLQLIACENGLLNPLASVALVHMTKQHVGL